jgi:hypothetical protein
MIASQVSGQAVQHQDPATAALRLLPEPIIGISTATSAVGRLRDAARYVPLCTNLTLRHFGRRS